MVRAPERAYAPTSSTSATTSPLASSATMMATETFGPMALARSAAATRRAAKLTPSEQDTAQILMALLVVNIAFGVMTRAAPQLNIFAIGFPLTLVLGMVILWISLADILNQYQPLASDALQFLRDLARAR